MDNGKTKSRRSQKTTEYNKLVRDKIPEIIKKHKQNPVTRIANDKEFSALLKDKILEEATELTNARNENEELEEIIDILELINVYMKEKKVDVDKIEKMRKFKLRKNGSFDKRIILERVE